MKCKCGAGLTRKMKFCPECGEKTERPKPVPQAAEMEKVKRILKVKEAAELLGISRSTLYRLVNEGQIPFVQMGSCKRFRAESLLAWAESQEKVTTAS